MHILFEVQQGREVSIPLRLIFHNDPIFVSKTIETQIEFCRLVLLLQNHPHHWGIKVRK